MEDYRRARSESGYNWKACKEKLGSRGKEIHVDKVENIEGGKKFERCERCERCEWWEVLEGREKA